MKFSEQFQAEMPFGRDDPLMSPLTKHFRSGSLLQPARVNRMRITLAHAHFTELFWDALCS